MRFNFFNRQEQKIAIEDKKTVDVSKDSHLKEEYFSNAEEKYKKLVKKVADLSLDTEEFLNTIKGKIKDGEIKKEIHILKEQAIEAANKTVQQLDKNIHSTEKVEELSIAVELMADKAVDLVLGNPEIISYMCIKYSLPEYEGRELKPGHRLVFVIPDEFKGRLVRDVVLRHRKDRKYAPGLGEGDWDSNGAYSRVELHDEKSDQWKQWKDPAGYNSDKFAEPRSFSDPENENLHDWLGTVGKISPDAVRVTNVGKNQDMCVSNIHGIEIIFHPEFENVKFEKRIYCNGTDFIDLEKNQLLPSYGGGEHTQGIYKGAVQLGGYQDSSFELCKDPGQDARLENGRLILKIDAGKKIAQLEVAVGDTEYLGSNSSRTMRLGWAKIWAGIRRAESGKTEWFMQNVNVPPQGVLAGGPHLENAKINDGDELVIESREDTSYIMGWRIAYKE